MSRLEGRRSGWKGPHMSTQGSIKRDESGQWYFIADLGPDPMTGRRRQSKRRGFPTKKAAQAALSDLLGELRRGEYVKPATGSLGAYLMNTWLPARRADLRSSTAHGYEKVIRTRIVPFIGNAPLSTLDAATLEAFYGRLLLEGGKGGTQISPKTVANTAGVIGGAR